MSEALLPPKSAVRIDQMRGEDDLDDRLLHGMAAEAIRYISALPWCETIHEKFFGDGFGGIIALFLFRVSIRKLREPEWIWVIVGDVPSAYLEAKDFPTARAALGRYIDGVEDWIVTPENERDSREDLPPIHVPAADELIEMLKTRLFMIRESFLPHIKAE